MLLASFSTVHRGLAVWQRWPLEVSICNNATGHSVIPAANSSESGGQRVEETGWTKTWPTQLNLKMQTKQDKCGLKKVCEQVPPAYSILFIQPFPFLKSKGYQSYSRISWKHNAKLFARWNDGAVFSPPICEIKSMQSDRRKRDYKGKIEQQQRWCWKFGQ